MWRPGFPALILLVSAAILGTGVVSGQTTSTGSGQAYPNKPIRIVTAGVGGAGDVASRLIAQGLSGGLGQQVIVENRPSGATAEAVAKAPPDGYTLHAGGGNLWIKPFLEKTSYDPVRDFSPITLATRSPNLIAVHPSVPVKSVKELIALAKAKPGELNYASAGTGGAQHLAAELFKAMAGVNIVRINYKSAGAAVNDLIGGQVQMTFASPTAVTPHLKSGRLRALAVTSAQPTGLAPGLPTVAASGLPGYESAFMFCIFAPGGTPEAIIKRLNQEIVWVLSRADVKEKFFSTGVEAVGSSPDELAAYIKSNMARMGKLIRDAGISAE